MTKLRMTFLALLAVLATGFGPLRAEDAADPKPTPAPSEAAPVTPATPSAEPATPVAPTATVTPAAPVAKSSVPDFENEFYNDFTNSTANKQKIDIQRNLRLGSQTSDIYAVLVVIKKLADYPDMPQEIHAFADKLAQERKVGSAREHKGVLVLYALEDRKSWVAPTNNLDQALATNIRDALSTRVKDALKKSDVGQAMLYASEDIASTLPKAAAAKPVAPATAPVHTAQAPVQRATPAAAPQQKADSGWGIWGILLAIGIGFVVLLVVARLFSGGSSAPGYGYGGGGGPGWGGMFAGMLGGGLLGYWLGSSSSHADASTPTNDSNNSIDNSPSLDNSSSFDSSSSDSSFDSGGGGDFGGGGGAGDSW